MYQYPFEKLEVWKMAKDLAKNIYQITLSFPNEEKYGMVSQMRRAVVSVSSNITEGTARRTQKDQGHFYTMAYGSLIELLNQLIIVTELNWLEDESYKKIRTSIEIISKKLFSLRKSVLP